MKTLVAVLTIGISVLLQSSLVVRFNLLNGAADLVLLVLVSWMLQEGSKAHLQWCLIAGLLVGFISEMPIWLPLVAYVLVMLVVRNILMRIWQSSVIVLFFVTLIGSGLVLGLEYMYLALVQGTLPFMETFNLVILPSIVLNILLILPVNALIAELAHTVYPPAVEI